jgi:hypothetical protein
MVQRKRAWFIHSQQLTALTVNKSRKLIHTSVYVQETHVYIVHASLGHVLIIKLSSFSNLCMQPIQSARLVFYKRQQLLNCLKISLMTIIPFNNFILHSCSLVNEYSYIHISPFIKFHHKIDLHMSQLFYSSFLPNLLSSPILSVLC